MTHIHQAMILAAGKGTRLRPMTLTTPKPLIPVGGLPLIVWHILALKKAGFTQITLNASWLADTLQNALQDGSQYGVTLNWSIEPTPLETAGGIAHALHTHKLNPNAPFLLLNGDIWTNYDLTPLTQHTLAPNALAHLLLIDNPEHNPQGDFTLKNGLLTPDDQSTPKLTFSGISLIHPKLLQSVKNGEEKPLAPLLRHAITNQQITGEKITATWFDVGTPERLQQTNQWIAQNQANPPNI